MSPPQSNIAVETSCAYPEGAVRIEFAYEPIFWSRTQAILAYEQLARRPGDFDASFLSELSERQTSLLDRHAVDVAYKASQRLKTPVFVNAFPENVEQMAHRLSLSTQDCLDNVGLEVNEDFPLDELVSCMRRYPEIWWILDDLDLRKDSFDTVSHPVLRSLPITAKFHFQSALNSVDHRFDLNVLPRNWMVIVEGVKPELVDVLKNRGVSFIQGRSLGRKERNVTGHIITI